MTLLISDHFNKHCCTYFAHQCNDISCGPFESALFFSGSTSSVVSDDIKKSSNQSVQSFLSVATH